MDASFRRNTLLWINLCTHSSSAMACPGACHADRGIAPYNRMANSRHCQPLHTELVHHIIYSSNTFYSMWIYVLTLYLYLQTIKDNKWRNTGTLDTHKILSVLRQPIVAASYGRSSRDFHTLDISP
jgi:hypothetical protein